MPSLLKRAAIHGVVHSLVAKGACEFPSKEAMDAAADAVADGPIGAALPETSGAEGHDPAQLAQAAQKLMEIAQALMAEAQGAGGAGGAPPAPEAAAAAKQAAEQLKVAAAQRDVGEVAGEVALALMDKAAAETKLAGDPKLVGVGVSAKNDLSHSAGHDSVGALDKKNRPEGKYVVGQGQTGLDTAKGQIGASAAPTVSPSKSPSGSNSVTEGTKKAEQLREIVQKHANKLVGLHEAKPNTLANAPDSVAQLDVKNRGAEGAYHVGQGNANFSEPQAARIGVEKKPDVKPSQSPAGTNSVIQASKAAGEEEQFIAAFGKCAQDVGAYLPATLSDDEKVAAITDMIPMDRDGRQAKLNELQKVAEQKKESALLARVREIASKASTPKAA